MNFELLGEISLLIKEDKLDEAIVLTEKKLIECPPTAFNKLLGKNLLHETDRLVEYFSHFYNKVKDNLQINAMYAEMNGFTINYDLWFLHLFAYDKVGDTDDTDWLADWEEENSTKEIFPITGFEELQMVYKDYMENQKYNDDKMESASDVAEFLIVLRFQELIRAVKLEGKKRNLSYSSCPVFATAHDYYDMILRLG